MAFTLSALNANQYGSPSAAYSAISSQLSQAVTTGQFTTYLQQGAIYNGAGGLATVSVSPSSLQVVMLTSTPTAPPTMVPTTSVPTVIVASALVSSSPFTASVLGGIAIASLLVLGAAGGLLYYFMSGRKPKKESKSPGGPQGGPQGGPHGGPQGSPQFTDIADFPLSGDQRNASDSDEDGSDRYGHVYRDDSSGGGRGDIFEDPWTRRRAPARLSTASLFRKEDLVLGNYRGKGCWYPGKISVAHGDGIYDIDYEDGDLEKRVREERIKPRTGDMHSLDGAEGRLESGGANMVDNAPQSVGNEVISAVDTINTAAGAARGARAGAQVGGGRGHNERFELGTPVEANFEQAGQWFPGIIVRVGADGTYDLAYDDGDYESSIAASNIRDRPIQLDSNTGRDEKTDHATGEPANKFDAVRGKKSTYAAAAHNHAFQVGSKIFGNFDQAGDWFPGRISRVNGDGTFDIAYDDGDVELHVAEAHIQLPATAAAPGARLTGPPSGVPQLAFKPKPADPGHPFSIGALIVGNFGGDGEWFEGQIFNVRDDGTFDILYDDGDTETCVPAEHIRLRPVDTPTHHASQVSHGRDSLRHPPFGGDPLLRQLGGFSVGAVIFGNFDGAGDWYQGTVSNVNDDGTYEILYDDGDTESNVPASHLRKEEELPGGQQDIGAHTGAMPNLPRGQQDIGANTGAMPNSVDGPPLPALHRYKLGMLVMGNYQADGDWYSGRIVHLAEDGTYDVQYDDGDSESNVLERNIRPQVIKESGIPEVHTGASPNTVFIGPETPINFQIGAPISANYNGEGIWFTGKITHVLANGTYGILYDDGDVEHDVSPQHIQPLVEPVIDDSRDHPNRARLQALVAFERSYPIEANYLGAGTWYPGNIVKVRRDGTFNITYDNGEVESCVPLELIRTFNDNAAIVYRTTDSWDADSDHLDQDGSSSIRRVRFATSQLPQPNSDLKFTKVATIDPL